MGKIYVMIIEYISHISLLPCVFQDERNLANQNIIKAGLINWSHHYMTLAVNCDN